MELIERLHWHNLAACAGMGPRIFFPLADKTNRRTGTTAYEPARQVCARCPVVEQCAEAGRAEHYGIWGGVSMNEHHPRQRLTARPTALTPLKPPPTHTTTPGP